MTFKELKEMINNIPDKFNDSDVRVYIEEEHKEVTYARGVVTPNGNACCVEIVTKK